MIILLQDAAAHGALHQQAHAQRGGREAHVAPLDPPHRDRLVLTAGLPVSVRVRMACAFGAVMGALALSGDVFADVPAPELGDMLRSAVHALLADAAGRAVT